VPAAFARDDPISFRRSPSVRFVLIERGYVSQDRGDNAPGSFDSILAAEKGWVAPQRITDQTLIRQHLFTGVLTCQQFYPSSDHEFSGYFGPRPQGNKDIGPEAEV
jgi:hypothetical protein